MMGFKEENQDEEFGKRWTTKDFKHENKKLILNPGIDRKPGKRLQRGK